MSNLPRPYHYQPFSMPQEKQKDALYGDTGPLPPDSAEPYQYPLPREGPRIIDCGDLSDQEAHVRSFLELVKGAIRIPAGTQSRLCKRCPAMMWFVGNRCVSIEPYKTGPEGIAPTLTEDGAGVDHHATCPKAAEFRRKK